jgi:hypothetical protein
LYFNLAERHAPHCRVDATLDLFLVPSIREYMKDSLKLHAIRFATHEEAHYLAIDYANVFQI